MNELRITPCRTVVTSFQPRKISSDAQQLMNSNGGENHFEDGDWIVCATSGHNQWVSCALSNGEIQVYDQERLHLKQTYRLPTSTHHNNMATSDSSNLITDLVGDASSSNPSTLAATFTDGTVAIFDIRQPATYACHFSLPRNEEQALSVSLGFDGTLAAVGSSIAKIHFFDVRSAQQQTNGGSLLGTYNQSHNMEVTQVRFQPLHSASFGTTATSTTTSPMLVSGGEDGLACVFDTSAPSEEAALKNVFSVQSAIRQVGFFGAQSEGIYCLTGSESLQLYHIDDSTCRHDYGPNFRQHLSQRLCANPPNAMSNSPPNLGYLVSCQWDVPRQELLLLAGTSYGEGGVFTVKGNDVNPRHWLGGGHRGVIRAFSYCSSNSFVTVGEDARLCEWNQFGRQAHSAAGGHCAVTSGFSNQPAKSPAQFPSKGNAVSSPSWKQRKSASSSTPASGSGGGGPMRRQRQRTAASPY